MYADHAEEAPICQCLCLQFFASSAFCTAWGAAQKCRLTELTARIPWDTDKIHLTCAAFSFTKALPRSFRKALQTQRRAGCWLDKLFQQWQPAPSDWMYAHHIKRLVLSVGDGYVSGCLTESARCHAQMPRSDATWTSCHKTGDGPCWWALHQKHPSLAWAWSLLSMKALLGRISDVSSTVLTFSALTQKQNSFPWSMLNAECTHPSLLSFSYFCFPIDLCYHKKVCEMWAWHYEAGRYSDISSSLKAFSAICKC